MTASLSQAEHPIRMIRSKEKEEKVTQTHDVRVGKDVLELITGAMYVDPLTIFREYVQNAADALDARSSHGGTFEPEIHLNLNPAERAISIRDNGTGVANHAFIRTLTSIGDSPKRGTRARGFRGIGRLSGLGYCRELVFRSASKDDSHVYEMRWDGLRFKQILRDPAYDGDLNTVIREVLKTNRTKAPVDEPFFEVEMLGVVRVRNDSLLNLDSVRNYLAQVAPVPFDSTFEMGREVEQKLESYGVTPGYRTVIQEVGPVSTPPEEIVKPYRSRFASAAKHDDRLESVRFLELPGLHDGVSAVGWVADHGYFGAIPRTELIGGLRVRHGNIQVGGADMLSGLFPEPRFNSWSVGEVHVLSPSIVPNGRRDNFEENVHYLSLQGHLVPVLRDIARQCRQKSAYRQWVRRFEAAERVILDGLERLQIESLSKRQRSDLFGSLNEQSLKLLDRARACRFSTKQEFIKRAEVLVATVRRATVGLSAETDPLEAVPYAKRLAFQEVLSLIHEYSGSRDAAKKLVASITRHLAAKHGG